VVKFSWLHVHCRLVLPCTILAHHIWSSWQSMDKKTRCSCFFHVIWFSYPKLCDKVCQWLATTGRWFSPGNPVSSTNKTDHHDITKILLKLKVALNTIHERNGWTLIFLFWTVSVLSPDHECPYQCHWPICSSFKMSFKGQIPQNTCTLYVQNVHVGQIDKKLRLSSTNCSVIFDLGWKEMKVI